MHRLFLLVPDISTTKRIAEHVKSNGITEGHIHVVGKSALAIEHLHLHQANLLQTTNLPKALISGAILGLLIGTAAGIILAFLTPWGITVPATGIMVFTFIGIILGLWISGLVGIAVKNPIIEKLDASIKEGKYLMMIDLDNDQEELLAGEIIQRFPLTQVASPTVH